MGHGSQPQVRLPDPQLAPQHAAFKLEEERLLVVDMGTPLGTLLPSLRPECPAPVAAFVEQMLEKDPDDRPEPFKLSDAFARLRADAFPSWPTPFFQRV